MSGYRDYTIDISLKSPIVTPFQSDTIFGHICWAISYLKWEAKDKLAEFLDFYDKEESIPPLLLSNGFPAGFLPKPIIPPIKQEVLEGIIKREDRIENSFKIKTIKKAKIIAKDYFAQVQNEMITPQNLFKKMFNQYDALSKELKKVQSAIIQHNTVNRLGIGNTRLYSQEEYFYNNQEDGKFIIYLKTYYFSPNDLERIFHFISDQGFGRDKSTGKGYFEFKIKEGIDLPESDSPNAFMSLSSFIPKDNDPNSGYYQILLKYGKLGGHFAKGGAEVNANPFKKPLMMFSAGSTFYDYEYHKDKIYGQLLKDIHHNQKIRHYAYAFPIGIKLMPVAKEEI
ncbi:MAG: type III-A CRISPR-associated RAMP protein Csm4 [bacterium]